MNSTQVLTLVTLVVTGFVSCAEFGSYAFVHPVLRRLPRGERIMVEQGLLRTFGRVMPFGMTASLLLAIGYASANPASVWGWLAVAAFATSLVCTLIFNVPINLATGKWDADNPPPDWERKRGRWEFFQGLRSWLLLAGFILICVAVTSEGRQVDPVISWSLGESNS